MPSPYQQFTAKFPQTELNKPLAPLTSMHVGGPADLFYKLTDINELPQLIQTAKKLHIPYFILGGGSNTIFADEGFRGLIIHMQAKKIALEAPPSVEAPPSFVNPPVKATSKVDSELKGQYISAEAGALLSQVIQFALKQGLSGMGKMMGLPGTIGGAVRGNAGAFGIEIKDIFASALIFNEEKGLQEANKDYFQFAYRQSTVKKGHDIVLKIFLKLHKTDPAAAKAALAEATDIVKNRISKQPKGHCSGSFFKNPAPPYHQVPKLKAGYLLEQAGCKGLKHGQAQVSPQHANWIMNLGGATQKDILELKNTMQQKVKNRFNISLEPEVQLVGSTGPMKL